MTYSGDERGAFARNFDSLGNATSDSFQVDQITFRAQQQSTVAVNEQGEFVIAWSGNGLGDRQGIFEFLNEQALDRGRLS